LLLLPLCLNAAPHAALGQSTPPLRYYSVTDLGPGDAFRVRNLGLGVTTGALDLALCPAGSGSRAGFLWNGQNGKRAALCPLAGDVLAEIFDFEQLGAWSAVGLSGDAAGNHRPTLWAQQSDGSFVPQLLRFAERQPGGHRLGGEHERSGGRRGDGIERDVSDGSAGTVYLSADTAEPQQAWQAAIAQKNPSYLVNGTSGRSWRSRTATT
jgi:hypothetical protein